MANPEWTQPSDWNDKPKFVDMRRWSAAKLDKELAFICADSPDALDRAWAEAVLAEEKRRVSQ